MKRCRAFTLIELLTVIAIIAIIASILFPVLSAAQERGKLAQCLANVRQWGNATTLYMADSGGVFPEKGSATADGLVANKDIRENSKAWFNALPRYIGTLPMSNMWGQSDAKLRMPRPPVKSPFICPSAKPELTIPPTEYRTYYSSYAQGCWVDAGANARGCAGPGSSGLSKVLRMSQVKNPATFPIMAENASGAVGAQRGYRLAHTHARIMGSPDSGDAFRHNGKANICFADGHAASFDKDAIYDSSMGDLYSNYGAIQWNPDRNLDGTCP